MPTEWIMALGVLLVAGAILCFVVRRYEKRERPWQIKASEESERRIAAAKERDRRGAHPEHQQPDIPVWRDKPTGLKE